MFESAAIEKLKVPAKAQVDLSLKVDAYHRSLPDSHREFYIVQFTVMFQFTAEVCLPVKFSLGTSHCSSHAGWHRPTNSRTAAISCHRQRPRSGSRREFFAKERLTDPV